MGQRHPAHLRRGRPARPGRTRHRGNRHRLATEHLLGAAPRPGLPPRPTPTRKQAMRHLPLSGLSRDSQPRSSCSSVRRRQAKLNWRKHWVTPPCLANCTNESAVFSIWPDRNEHLRQRNSSRPECPTNPSDKTAVRQNGRLAALGPLHSRTSNRSQSTLTQAEFSSSKRSHFHPLRSAAKKKEVSCDRCSD